MYSVIDLIFTLLDIFLAAHQSWHLMMEKKQRSLLSMSSSTPFSSPDLCMGGVMVDRVEVREERSYRGGIMLLFNLQLPLY
jgi:hypothetical protein